MLPRLSALFWNLRLGSHNLSTLLSFNLLRLKKFKKGAKMNYQATLAYLTVMEKRYKNANRSVKTTLLEEMAVVTELSRKHLIRRMSKAQKIGTVIHQKRSGRPLKYHCEALLPHVKFLWVSMESISPRRM